MGCRNYGLGHLRLVIQTFGDYETERIFRGERSKKLPGDIQAVARRKLSMIHQAGAFRICRPRPEIVWRH